MRVPAAQEHRGHDQRGKGDADREIANIEAGPLLERTTGQAAAEKMGRCSTTPSSAASKNSSAVM